ncbi:MAG TPA: hypothetical protein VLH37_02690 [Bacteroidales bacterium]|nr:hypothetical protein [Bacteroidales bacterium]
MKKKILSLAFAALLTIGLATTTANAEVHCFSFLIVCGDKSMLGGYICGHFQTAQEMVDLVWGMGELFC